MDGRLPRVQRRGRSTHMACRRSWCETASNAQSTASASGELLRSPARLSKIISSQTEAVRARPMYSPLQCSQDGLRALIT